MKTFTLMALVAAYAHATITYGDKSGKFYYTFDAYYDENTAEIVMKTTQPTGTFMGVLLGSATMWDTDAIMWQSTGTGAGAVVSNYYSTGNVPPTLSAVQSISFTVTSTANDRTAITSRRLINPNVDN